MHSKDIVFWEKMHRLHQITKQVHGTQKMLRTLVFNSGLQRDKDLVYSCFLVVVLSPSFYQAHSRCSVMFTEWKIGCFLMKNRILHTPNWGSHWWPFWSPKKEGSSFLNLVLSLPICFYSQKWVVLLRSGPRKSLEPYPQEQGPLLQGRWVSCEGYKDK